MLDTIKAFIVPRGRTGGTLFATMLDAHPELTFGYEIYPDKLCDNAGVGLETSEVIQSLESSYNTDPEIWIKAMVRGNFRTFCARARRSGLEMSTLLEELNKFVALGNDFTSMEGRLNFIDQLIEVQRLNSKKQFAGSKMRVDPYLLHERHPDTAYYMMLRDGRDVLDSRLRVGNFQTSAKECAEDWVNSLKEFEKFLADTGARGCLVKYEDLVYQPEVTLKNVLVHAGLDYNASMLNYMEKDPALLKAPHGHLSAKQISEGLNDKTVGRWKTGLSKEDKDLFMAIASESLERYGYELA